MSLRVRLGLAAGVAVALAVVAVAASAYAGTRSELLGQLDSTIRQLSQQLIGRTGGGPGQPNQSQGQSNQPGGASQEQNANERAGFEAVGVFRNDKKTIGAGEGD